MINPNVVKRLLIGVCYGSLLWFQWIGTEERTAESTFMIDVSVSSFPIHASLLRRRNKRKKRRMSHAWQCTWYVFLAPSHFILSLSCLNSLRTVRAKKVPTTYVDCIQRSCSCQHLSALDLWLWPVRGLWRSSHSHRRQGRGIHQSFCALLLRYPRL